MSSKLLRGTFILTLGTYISKILGLFYIIPFAELVGKHGTALYQYGYVPYTIFLSIGTAGIPLAVSKFIAKYNTLEEYAVGHKLFKSGLWLMTITGLISFLTLYLSAPVLADVIIADDDQLSTSEDVEKVIRAVSFALIVVPAMSLMRGFFQGHQSMGPSAASQVIEQIVRIVFLLSGAYLVLKIMNGTVIEAVQVATFAAFLGGIGGLLVLIWYWYKRKPYLDKLLEMDKSTFRISYWEMYKEIIYYAIPFVIVGIANPLFQLVDTLTFNKAMAEIGLAKYAEQSFATLNFYSHKLVIIPVSLATAFSLTLVPLVTNAFVKQDYKLLHSQLNQTFQVLLFLTLPASIGITVLAEPIYTVFYGHDSFGTNILAIYSPVAILFALFSVTAAILQGINEQRYTVFSLLFGLLLKLSLNIPLIKWLETEGAILATAIGYLAAILINLGVIKYYANYRYQLVFRRGIFILILNLIMYIAVYLFYHFLTLWLAPTNRFHSIIIIVVCAFVGAAVYFYLSKKSKLLYLLFKEQIQKMKKRLS